MPVASIVDPSYTLNGRVVEVQNPGADDAHRLGVGPLRTAQRRRILYDSGLVAGGAEIVSPILDLRGFSRVRIIYYNADLGVARPLKNQEYAEDGVTAIPVLFAGGRILDNGAADSTRWAVLSDYERVGITSFTPGTFVAFMLGAGGTSNGRLVVFGE